MKYWFTIRSSPFKETLPSVKNALRFYQVNAFCIEHLIYPRRQTFRQPQFFFIRAKLLGNWQGRGVSSETSGEIPGNKSSSKGIGQDWHRRGFLSRLRETVDWVFSSTEKRRRYQAFYSPRERILKIFNGLCVHGRLRGWSNPPLTPQGGGCTQTRNLAPAG